MLQTVTRKRRSRSRSPRRPSPALVLTDQPENWSVLVEQIVELEELLAEASDGTDADATYSIATLREMLNQRRAALRAIDVG